MHALSDLNSEHFGDIIFYSVLRVPLEMHYDGNHSFACCVTMILLLPH